MRTIAESLQALRASANPPAEPSLLDLVQARTGIVFPPSWRELYSVANGAELGAFPGSILSVKDAAMEASFPIDHTVYTPWPFFLPKHNQSDPVCVICSGPGTGWVVQICHDSYDRVLADSIEAFLDRMAENPPDDMFFGGSDEVDNLLFPRSLTAADRELVQQFIDLAPTAEDPYEGESMYDLAASMMRDDDYVSFFGGPPGPIRNYWAIVCSRLRRIDSDAARAALAQYPARLGGSQPD